MKHFLFIVLACLAFAAIRGCEFSGYGQSIDSPDGERTASATQYYFSSPPEMRYRIRDKTTGDIVWKHDQLGGGSSDPPYGAGFGNLELIQWSNDSTEVRFAIRSSGADNVTAWIAAQPDGAGGFAAGVKLNAGLRPVDRTER